MSTTHKPTPAGVLLLPAGADPSDWHAARRGGITATDLPAILGLSRYKTAIDVWMGKLGHADDQLELGLGSNEAALWGIALEDAVARTWAEQTGVAVRRVGIIANETSDWMRASLDRLVTGCPDGRCAVEVKTRSGYVGDEWAAGVPADVEAQVRWQLLVSGLDHIHVIALIGGQRLVQHVVTLEGVDLSTLMDPARIVWDSVQSGEAPIMPETVWTDEYLEQLHADRAGDVEVDVAASTLAGDYQAVLDEIKQLEGRKAELRTQLIGALGEADTALFGGRQLYSYKSSATRRWDSKAAAELYPDAVADDRCYQISNSRTLRFPTTKKGN